MGALQGFTSIVLIIALVLLVAALWWFAAGRRRGRALTHAEAPPPAEDELYGSPEPGGPEKRPYAYPPASEITKTPAGAMTYESEWVSPGSLIPTAPELPPGTTEPPPVESMHAETPPRVAEPGAGFPTAPRVEANAPADSRDIANDYPTGRANTAATEPGGVPPKAS